MTSAWRLHVENHGGVRVPICWYCLNEVPEASKHFLEEYPAGYKNRKAVRSDMSREERLYLKKLRIESWRELWIKKTKWVKKPWVPKKKEKTKCEKSL